MPLDGVVATSSCVSTRSLATSQVRTGGSMPMTASSHLRREPSEWPSPFRVTGGCRRQVDGTAGLPSAPEMPGALRQLRLVPEADLSPSCRGALGQLLTISEAKEIVETEVSQDLGEARSHARQPGASLFASGVSPSLLNAWQALVDVGSCAIAEAPWSPQDCIASNVGLRRSSRPMSPATRV
jgi:hypothetical protein